MTEIYAPNDPLVPKGCRTGETADGRPAGAEEVRGGDVRASRRRGPPEFREFRAGPLQARPPLPERSRAVQHVFDAAKPGPGRCPSPRRRDEPTLAPNAVDEPVRRRSRNGRTRGRLRLPSRQGRRVVRRARRCCRLGAASVDRKIAFEAQASMLRLPGQLVVRVAPQGRFPRPPDAALRRPAGRSS